MTCDIEWEQVLKHKLLIYNDINNLKIVSQKKIVDLIEIFSYFKTEGCTNV